MKTSLILLLATVIPLGWIVLGVIFGWRVLVARCRVSSGAECSDYDTSNCANLFSYPCSAFFISAT